MQQILLRFLIAWCVALFSTTHHFANAEEPTVDELIQLGSQLSSEDANCQSFDIGMNLKNKNEKNITTVNLKFRARYRAQGQYALSICDGVDGTPLIIAAENQALVYDPIRPAVLYFTGAKPRFIVRQETDRVLIDFGVATKSGEVTCDVKSFLLAPRKDSEVAKDADGTYRLILTSLKGNFAVATFDASQPPAWSKFEILKQGEEQPTLSINRISTDGAAQDNALAFPNMDQLRKRINVKEQLVDGLLPFSRAVAFVMRSAGVRFAIHDPQLRDATKGIDWGQVQENDRTYSKALRELVLE